MKFYTKGFEDIKAEYKPELEKLLKEHGFIQFLAFLNSRYARLYEKPLIEMELSDRDIVQINSDLSQKMWSMIGGIGFAGILEYISELLEENPIPIESEMQDKIAWSQMASRLKLKSEEILSSRYKNSQKSLSF